MRVLPRSAAVATVAVAAATEPFAAVAVTAAAEPFAAVAAVAVTATAQPFAAGGIPSGGPRATSWGPRR